MFIPASPAVRYRTGLQKADMQLMSIMKEENQGRSSYVMVLTKCDRISDKKVRWTYIYTLNPENAPG